MKKKPDAIFRDGLDDRRLSQMKTRSPLVHLYLGNGQTACGCGTYRHYVSSSIDNVTCPKCQEEWQGDKGNVKFLHPEDGPATEVIREIKGALPGETAKEYGLRLFLRTHPAEMLDDDKED